MSKFDKFLEMLTEERYTVNKKGDKFVVYDTKKKEECQVWNDKETAIKNAEEANEKLRKK